MKKIGTILLIGYCFFIASTSCNHNKADVAYPACDTTNVSLAKDLVPIMVVNCYNCHSAVNAPVVGDNYNLEDYNTLVTFVDTTCGCGQLIASIQHSAVLPDYMFMPKNGNKLSTCDINKFIAWGKQGGRNN